MFEKIALAVLLAAQVYRIIRSEVLLKRERDLHGKIEKHLRAFTPAGLWPQYERLKKFYEEQALLLEKADVVVLSGRALEILRRRLKLRSEKREIKGAPLHFRSRFVFPNERGDGPRKEISRVIRPLARSLGLVYGTNVAGGFSPHSTRHTATTRMLRAGFDIKTIQDVVGHSDRVMSLRYAHSTRESRRAAVESLAEVKSKRRLPKN
jgi:integrase